MKRSFAALMVIVFLSACGPAANTPTPDLPTLIPPSPAPSVVEQPSLIAVPIDTPVELATPVCISSEPTQEDIDRALVFTGVFFETPDWEKSYTVSEGKVSVTWLSGTLSAVGFLEALIFSCGYEDLDLDAVFSDENWAMAFGGYQSYEAVSECRTDDGLRLYQFKAVDQGADYNIRYWVVNDTETRVITMMLVLPIGSAELMDEYSYSLFPQLTTCN